MSIEAKIIATPLEYNSSDKKDDLNLNSSDSSNISIIQNSWAEEVQNSEQIAKTEINKAGGENSNSQERQLSFEFIEGINEKKFERLVKEEKNKTPIKRRHSSSHSSRSGSQNSSGSECEMIDLNDEKRLRHNSNTSSSSSSSAAETDPGVLMRRQKQIDYGKNTVAYSRYLEMVPKAERTREHPQTPNKYIKYSRRAFDGLVKIWRKQLHYYDPPQADVKDNVDEDAQ